MIKDYLIRPLMATILLTAIAATGLQAQTGTDFWFAAPELNDGSSSQPNYLVITTYDESAVVEVDMPAKPGWSTIQVFVPANTTRKIDLYAYRTIIETQYDSANYVLDRGLHITSTEMITLSYSVSKEDNQDLWSLKGDNAMGQDFYIAMQNRWDNDGTGTPTPISGFIITAAYNNTTVNITPTGDLFDNGGALPVTLDSGETYMCRASSELGANHPAGVHVGSDKDIAITTYDDKVYETGMGTCRNMNGDQLVPVNRLGTDYAVIKGDVTGTDGEHIFIIGTQNGTNLNIDGAGVGSINAGQVYDAEITNPVMYINADQPVYVYHMSGRNCQMAGAVVPPLNSCNGNTELAFTRKSSATMYLMLLVKDGAENDFVLNNNASLIEAGDFTPVPNYTGWQYARVQLNTTDLPTGGGHLIENTEDVFHMAVLNGNGSNFHNYGWYSDFNDLVINAQIIGTTEENDSLIKICYGDSAHLYVRNALNVEWGPKTSIDNPYSNKPWVYPDVSTDYYVTITGLCGVDTTDQVKVYVGSPLDANWGADQLSGCDPLDVHTFNSSVGANIYYWYIDGVLETLTNDTSVIFNDFTAPPDTLQEYELKLVIENAIGCRDTLARTVTAYPAVSAAFSTTPNPPGCPPLEIDFTNASTPLPYADLSFEWDFGDGDYSSATNPSHIYDNILTTDTTYPAKMVAINEYLCTDTAERNIVIRPMVQAAFTASYQTNCAPLVVDFDNQSTAGANISYKWNLGDGTVYNTNADTNIVHTYNNAFFTPQNYTVRLIATNSNGCKDTLEQIITVYPDINAVFSLGGDTVGCSPHTINPINSSNPGGAISDYYWDFGDGASSADIVPEHSFYYTGATDTSYIVMLAVSSSSYCRDTIWDTVRVLPNVSANFAFNFTSNCSPLELDLENNSSGAQHYYWDFTYGHPGSIDTIFIDTPADTGHTYVNNGPSDSTYTIKLKAWHDNGCADSLTRNITVYPMPTADFTMTPGTGCHPYSVTFTDASTGDISYYDWQFGDGAASTSGGPVVHSFNNFTATTVTYSTTLTVSASAYCKDSTVKQIQVYPFVDAVFSDSGSIGCSPYTTTFTDNSVNAASYEWRFGDGTPYSTLTNASHTYYDSTIGTETFNTWLYVTSPDGCVDSAKKDIQVYPWVEAGISVSATGGCNPLYVNFSENSSPTANSFYWEFGDGGSNSGPFTNHTFNNLTAADKIYTVTLTASSSELCWDTATIDIHVGHYLEANYSFADGITCTPYNVTFTNNSVNGDDYLWSFGDGSTSWADVQEDISHSYNNTTTNPIDYQVKLYAVNADSSCWDSITRTLTAYPAINANFGPGDTLGCGPLTIQFSDSSTDAATAWLWQFGDGASSIEQNPAHTFYNLTTTDVTYTVTMTASSSDNCQSSHTIDVTVRPYLEAAFSFDYGTICTPDSVEFTNNSSGATSYDWDFGNGTLYNTTATAPVSAWYSNTATDADTVSVQLNANHTNGCSDSVSYQLILQPQIIAGFDQTDTLGCSPLDVSFTDTSVGSASLVWRFGDGASSSDPAPTHTYYNFTSSDTTYQAMQIAISPANCKDTAYRDIEVQPTAFANISPDMTAGCDPLTVTADDISTGADTVIWIFAVGDTTWTDEGGQVQHTYSNPTAQNDTFQLKAIIVNNNTGCADSIVKDIIVYPQLIADAGIVTDTGCAPHTVNFDASGSSGANSYTWIFGDGGYATGTTTAHEYHNVSSTDTTFYTLLIAESPNFCSDTDTVIIHIRPLVEAVASFNYTQGCSPFVLSMDNDSWGASSYEWSFDHDPGLDFATTSTATYYATYTNGTGSPDTNYVTLRAFSSGNCVDSVVRPVIIWPQVTATFSMDVDTICSGGTINFTDNSVNAARWSWEFGDGAMSLQQDPSHLYNNHLDHDSTYHVTLTAKSGFYCADDTVQDIVVHPRVIADLGIHFTSNCAPFTPDSITNNSINADQYYWDFGRSAGDVDTINNKTAYTTITYQGNPGTPRTYTISLTAASSGNGCTDLETQSFTVYPTVTASLATTVTDGCPDLTVPFTNNSVNATSYLWEFRDGSSSTSTAPVHTFINNSYEDDTTYTVRLTATSSQFCQDADSVDITVYNHVGASFSVSQAFGCSPLSDSIEVDTSLGLTALELDFGDGTSSTTNQRDFAHTYTNTGVIDSVYTIKLVVEDAVSGCADSLTREVHTYPEVTASLSYIPNDTSCHDELIRFDTTGTINGDNFKWEFGDGGSSTQDRPTHRYANLKASGDTTFYIEMTALSGFGCSDTITDSIVVLPGVEAIFNLSNNGGCSPINVSITDVSQGGAAAGQPYIWDFGDGTSPIDTNVQYTNVPYTYSYAGLDDTSFVMMLVVENDVGCTDTMRRDITVLATAYAGFALSTNQGCEPLEVQFSGNSYPPTASYHYEFGDEASTYAVSPTHTYSNTSYTTTATYTVTLTSQHTVGSFQCFDDTTATITVYPRVTANFSMDQSMTCTPAELTISQLSDGATAGTPYQWDFNGDGTYESTDASATIYQTYTNPGSSGLTYDLTLRAENSDGCADSLTRTLTVYPGVTAAMQAFTTTGCSPHTITLDDNSTNLGGGGTFDWFTSDDTTSKHQESFDKTFYHYGATDTTYYITHVARSVNNCSDTIIDSVIISGQPEALFTLDTNAACTPGQITFTNASVGATGYYWTFGDGTNSTADTGALHTYTNSTSNVKSYTAKLQVQNSNNCTDQHIEIIDIYPTIRFGYDMELLECWPQDVAFSAPDTLGYTYEWDYGDGNTGTGTSPRHTYRNYTGSTQTYTITVKATSGYGCTDSTSGNITLANMPNADFEVDSLERTWPDKTVLIDNASTEGSWSYAWDFGDGFETTEKEPESHSYGMYGEYIISLTIIDSTGNCTAETEKTLVINKGSLTSSFTISGAQGCPPLEVTFYNTSPDRANCRWNFGNGQYVYSDDSTLTYTYRQSGEFPVSLTVYGIGDEQTNYDTVIVDDLPDIEFEAYPTNDPTQAPPPRVDVTDASITFYNQTTNAVEFEWMFGDGQTSTENNPVYSYTGEGAYNVSLAAVTEEGCTDTLTKEQYVLVESPCLLQFPTAFRGGNQETGGSYTQPESAEGITSEVNKIFHPKHDGIIEYELMIFNTWGELIYRSEDVNVGWDGFYDGQAMPQGVYVWKAIARCKDGTEVQKAGDVTLIR